MIYVEINKDEIEVRIFEYQDKINLYQRLLRKGHKEPSKLRNAIVDYKVEVQNLRKLMEVI